MTSSHTPEPIPTADPLATPSITRPACTGTALTVAPFVPAALLRQHHSVIATDTRFAAATRLLASLWRADQGLAPGQHVSRRPDGATRRSRAGWRLRPDAARAGAAFLSPAVTRFVHRALVLREPSSLWDEAKIRGHLLSSQGLCLNLLAPMAIDLDLATAVWSRLMPGFVDHVTAIRFESAPGRDDPSWLDDGTAFDCVLDVVTPDGEPGFIAIELKFIETFAGPRATPRPRYAAAAHACNLFIDPDAPPLYRAGLEQLRREHCLAQLMVDRGLASRGSFVLIGPRFNPRVAAAAQAYASHLIDPMDTVPERVGFHHLDVETILAALTAVGAGAYALALHRRYLDLARVAQLALGETPPEPPLAPTPVLCLPAPAALEVQPETGSASAPAPALPPAEAAEDGKVARPGRCATASRRPASSRRRRSAEPSSGATSAPRSRGSRDLALPRGGR